MSKQSITGDDMRDDDGAYDKENVVDSIAEKLAAFNGDTGDSNGDTGDTGDSDGDTGDTGDSNGDTGDTGDSNGDTGDTGDGDVAPEIPENLLRAAQHVGWKPEDVVAFWKSDPERAQSTFENIHKSVNNLSQQFASIGRTALQSKGEAGKSQQVAQPQQQVDDFIDVNKLREQHPDSELVDIIASMNDALKKAVAVRQPQTTVDESAAQRAVLQERMANIQKMNTFFGSDAMKSYAEYYGPVNDENGVPQFDWSYLQPGQMANRHAMLQTAEQILAGAEVQGQQMSVEQALAMAHLLQTAAMQKQNVRKELLASVTKRSKGATLKPKGKNTAQKVDKEQELITRVQQRLDKL